MSGAIQTGIMAGITYFVIDKLFDRESGTRAGTRFRRWFLTRKLEREIKRKADNMGNRYRMPRIGDLPDAPPPPPPNEYR